MPPLAVTGTRLVEMPYEQPYAYYRTEQPSLDQRVGRTALDRMNYGPGVFLQRTAPNQASPFIRGLTGEQTLLMLDGVRFSHAMMRPGPNQYAALIPELSIRSIDAILGASSVVNGSDGLTGALDVRLENPGRDVAGPHAPWLASRVDTANGGTLQLGLDGNAGDWAYSAELSGSLFHDRVGGKDFRDHVFGPSEEAYDSIPNTAYEEAAGALRIAYLGWAKHRVELKAGHTRQMNAPRPGGYFENSGDPTRLFRFFDPQTFSYVHLRDHWALDTPLAQELQTTLWWHRFGEEQFRASIRDAGTPEVRVRQRAFDDTLNAFGGDLQATTPLGRSGHELVWGATVIHERTDNQYEELRTPEGTIDRDRLAPFQPEDWPNKTSVSDGSTYTTLGLFLQDHWMLSDAFSLLAGGRFSYYAWSFGDVDGDTSDLTGSLRGQWNAPYGNRFFAGISRGFRAPNLNNLDGAVDRGSSGDPAQGNPDLEPEVSLTYEGGWKWRRDRESLALTLFHTRIDDLIQRDFAGSGEFTNVQDAELQGGEAAWDLTLLRPPGPGARRIALIGSVSLVDATKDVPQPGGGVREDNISRANRLYGHVGLRYTQAPAWWALARVRWHDDYDDVATDPSDSDASDVRLTVAGNPDGSMPGYAVADLSGGWRSRAGDRELGFFLENLGNITYREPGSGTDGPGRSLGVSGLLRF
jgi:outer membrane receptor protein involved in Fe transport